MTNSELLKVTNWFKSNKLIVNYDKTNFMYFSKTKIVYDDQLSTCIMMDNVQLTLTKNVRFLGVILDDRLNFNEHRSEIRRKISKNIGILFRLQSILPEKQLFMLYNSLILPYLQYCNISWASTGVTKLEPLFKLQKKALRICTSSHFLAHSQPLFYKFKTLNVFDIHTYQIAIIMFNNKSAILPQNISSLFQLNKNIHCYNTRQSSKLHYSKVNNERTLNLIRHQGPRIWNSLRSNITSYSYLSLFKNRCKLSLLSMYSH